MTPLDEDVPTMMTHADEHGRRKAQRLGSTLDVIEQPNRKRALA
jgi:hypothetical protein